jgi:hypothetical protein
MFKISHHSASTASLCFKKYWWLYEKGLEPITHAPVLSIGSAVHKAFDMFAKGLDDGEILRVLTEDFDAEIAKAELVDQEDLRIAKWTALGMWQFNPYKKTYFEEFEEVYTEEKFEVPLANLKGVRFIGRVDGRLKKEGDLWLHEIKTTGQHQRAFEGQTRTSPQATGYVYGLLKKGYPTIGVMYDVFNRPLLRKGANENVDDFARRIYNDYQTRPERYYYRVYTNRTPGDIAMWEREIVALVKDIRRRKRTGEWTRSLDSCWHYGSPCPYMSICLTDEPDELTMQLNFKRKEL